jgi:hypothetical protein
MLFWTDLAFADDLDIATSIPGRETAALCDSFALSFREIEALGGVLDFSVCDISSPDFPLDFEASCPDRELGGPPPLSVWDVTSPPGFDLDFATLFTDRDIAALGGAVALSVCDMAALDFSPTPPDRDIAARVAPAGISVQCQLYVFN